MPGAGTDKTKRWVEQPGPCVILVEPQLADNIGAAARAMANFGLSRLRLVAPKCGWPAERAYVMASGADRVLDAVQVFEFGRSRGRRPQFRVRHHGARARSGQARGRCGRCGATRRGEDRGGRERRADVRARAQRAGEPRGRARRPHHHAAGQSGLRLAQSRAGGGDRVLRMVQAGVRRRAAVRRCRGNPTPRRASNCSPSSRTSNTSWRRSNSSARPTSARRCRSTCATSSRACSRRSRTSRRCTASS